MAGLRGVTTDVGLRRRYETECHRRPSASQLGTASGVNGGEAIDILLSLHCVLAQLANLAQPVLGNVPAHLVGQHRGNLNQRGLDGEVGVRDLLDVVVLRGLCYRLGRQFRIGDLMPGVAGALVE